ncbi:MAG: hypothetical protein AB1466_01940 [Actinomycetota bacterium]
MPVTKNILNIALIIGAGLLLYSVLVFITPSVQDFFIPFIVGLFVGLFVKDLEKGTLLGFTTAFIGCFLFEYTPTSFYLLSIPKIGLSLIQGLIAILGSAFSVKLCMAGRRKFVLYSLLIFILLSFVVNATIFNTFVLKRVSFEPAPEGYAFDGFLYLKTFYLMKRGHGYYRAFGMAFDQDRRLTGTPPAIFGWRLPTIFWIWSTLLPANGTYLNYAFTFFSLLCICSTFIFARKFIPDEWALLASFLLAPYLLYAAMSFWFPFAEYWGFFFALFSLTFFCYHKQFESALFALLAVLTRELMIFVPVAGLLASVSSKNRKKIIIWILPLVCFSIFFMIHYLAVKPKLVHAPFDLSAWLHGGFGFVKSTLGFGLNFFAKGEMLKFLLLFLALLGVLMLPRRGEKMIFMACLLLPVFIFFIVGGPWRDYWGIIYMPFILIYAPMFFGNLSGYPLFNPKVHSNNEGGCSN